MLGFLFEGSQSNRGDSDDAAARLARDVPAERKGTNLPISSLALRVQASFSSLALRVIASRRTSYERSASARSPASSVAMMRSTS